MRNIAISDMAFMPAEPHYVEISSNNLLLQHSRSAQTLHHLRIVLSADIPQGVIITLHLVALLVFSSTSVGLSRQRTGLSVC